MTVSRGTEPVVGQLARPAGTFYLMSLALKCQDLGTASWLLGIAGGWEADAMLLGQVDLLR